MKKEQHIKHLTKLVKTKNTVPLTSNIGGPGPLMHGRPSLMSNTSKPDNTDKDSLLIGSDAQVLAFSSTVDLDMDDLDEFAEGRQMTRAEWYMAQVDLDPIESHGSLEMST